MDQGYDVYIGTNHIRKYGPILSVYGNPDATWEESRKLDVGVEIGLFDSLNIIFDWFKEKRSGIFMQRVASLVVRHVRTSRPGPISARSTTGASTSRSTTTRPSRRI